MTPTRSEICDLIKQVRVIEEPFSVPDLAELAVVSPLVIGHWVEALEGEGLITPAGKTKWGNRIINKYRRTGAFA
jgi:hypothetical protein